MKHTLINKAVSLTAAAALSCTGIIGSGIALPASAEETAPAADPTAVIVKVTGAPVLQTPEGEAQGVGFLDTEQAAAISHNLEATQSYVQREIRDLYPELAVGYSYSVLYNGFSCQIPEDLIDEVESLPYVEAVTPVRKTATPRMATAKSLSGAPAYYDATGCTGEGQLIAVIDSELDMTHPMFAPLDESKEVKLTEADIAKIADSIGFNVDIDPARAYRSNKLPYVIDYVEDPYDGLPDEANWHGSHVSGIAAGNEYEDADGNVISGIAKDAQLAFMAVGTSDGYMSDDALIAAIEDAIKLHADVINMSLGGNGEMFDEMSAFSEAFDAAATAGVTVCLAAGNEDNGTYRFGEDHLAPNPDTAEINALLTSGDPILTVASADNLHTEHYGGIQNGDLKIPYLPVYCMNEETYDYEQASLGDRLEGEYEYVYCGDGTPEELEGLDLEGKIVLMNSSMMILPEVIEPIKEAGAAGLLLIYPKGYVFEANVAVMGSLPAGCINYEDGQRLIEAENKTFTLLEETIDVDYPTAVSFYSSWGAKQTLELRPDIMGIGGYVESAAYGNGAETMSGTSMATPYLSGCSAVLSEYLERQGIELEGKERIRFMRNLLMSSAIPYEENGMFVSPRRQGSGMVSLNNVTADKVLLTGSTNETKIELKDKLSDTISFDLNLRNISEEDVDFTSARIVLTTDGSEWSDKDEQYHINGQQVLNCTADLGALTHVAAGESRTEQVTMNLDPAQTAQLGEIFTNGFFVEGYLLLEGAENCCDVSIPLFGFHGDWAKVPIFDAESVQLIGQLGDFGYTYTPSFAKAAKVLAEIRKNLPEDAVADPFAEIGDIYAENATEEQLALLDAEPDTYYISPNSDGLLDTIGFTVDVLRYGRWDGLDIFNENGELVSEGEKEPIQMRDVNMTGENRNDLNDLPDGSYIAQSRAMVDYADSIADPQVVEFPFVIDTTAPTVTGTVREENGRKILTVTAQDGALDGIFIYGSGRGGQVGVFDPDAEETDTDDYLSALQETASYFVGFASFTDRIVDPDQLPVIGKSLTGKLNPAETADMDFSDLIVAEPDENGAFTFEYDITDMSAYNITAIDKAFNMSSIAQEAKLVEELPSGVYKAHGGIYIFDGENMTFLAYQDAARTVKPYTMQDGILTADGEKIRVEQVSSLSYRLAFEDGTSELICFENEGTEEEYHFYSVDQIVGRVKAFMEASFPTVEVARTETSVDSTGTVLVRIYIKDERKGEVLAATAKVDNTTGSASSNQIGFFELFPVIPSDLDGVWMASDQDGKVEYWDMNTPYIVTAVSQADKSEKTFSFEIENDRMVFRFDKEEVPADYFVYDEGKAMFVLDNGTTLNVSKVSLNDIGKFRFFSDAELCEMALDYYEQQNGKRPEKAEVLSSIEGTVTIQVGDTTYVVDNYFASGTDGNGEEIDLLSTLPVMEDPFKSGIWMVTGNDPRYVRFDGNGGGTFKNMSDGESYDFTYEMTPVGIVLTFADEEAETTLKADLFVEEDGTVYASWDEEELDTFTFLQDGDFDSFSFYTLAELQEMATLHIPEEAPYPSAEVNPDGTVTIIMQDEYGDVKEIYTVDPTTAEGTDMNGDPADIKTVFEPEYPETAYGRDTLEEWAKNDVFKKTGKRAAQVQSVLGRDGSLYITMTDENGEVIDFYSIDPVTGEGTNQNGDAVNLPQTGNNAPQTAAVASGSVMLTLAGLFTAWRSGILRRKKRGE